MPSIIPILVFGEYCSNKTTAMYYYQDLTIDYLLRLQGDPIAEFAV